MASPEDPASTSPHHPYRTRSHGPALNIKDSKKQGWREAGREYTASSKKDKKARRQKKKAQRQKQGHKTSQGPNLEEPNQGGNTVSVNNLKSQIRNISRLLSRHSLPADFRQETERELAALREQLAGVQVRREGKQALKKYHMVRFFERQKATRTVKRLKKELASSETPMTEEEQDDLRKRIHIAEIDLWYATHAPLENVYVSIYPKVASIDSEPKVEQVPQTAEQLRKSRPALWHLIEQAVADGTVEHVRLGSHPGLSELGLGERVAVRKKLDELGGKLGDMSITNGSGASVLDERRQAIETADEDMKMDEDEDEEDGGFFEAV